MKDTIVALCTGTPPTALALVRLSGPGAWLIASEIFSNFPAEPEPRVARYGTFLFGDDGLALPFASGGSYTGDETVEFTLHGGRASVSALLEACLSRGARLAQGGEFTLRALTSGRIDLTQAEAVIETIEAQTSQELRIAHRNREGGLRHAITGLRDRSRDLLAEIEARIDFSEELGDLDPDSIHAAVEGLFTTAIEILRHGRTVHLARQGTRVALVGRPNAGKSSLLNALVGRDRAIVTDIPGTTRDTLEETVILGERRAVLIDTAGLRDSGDPIERIGIDRSQREIETADQVWYLYDASQGWTDDDDALLREMNRQPDLILATKHDLIEPGTPIRGIGISSLAQTGFDSLIAALQTDLPDAPAVNDRQMSALTPAITALQAILEAPTAAPDLLAVLLREVDQSLGTVLGEVAPTDLLDNLFSRFCVGK